MDYVPGYRPPAANAAELLERLRQPVGRARFSQCKQEGWLSGSSSAVSLCCDMFNHRESVAKALALMQALQRNKTALARAMTASCECQTKSPEPQHHEEECLYRVLHEALVDQP